MQRWY